MVIYLIKSGTCLVVFYLFYKLLLEREHFHVFKRIYLLASIILAFTIPLIVLTTAVPAEPITTNPKAIVQIEPNIPQAIETQTINYWPIVLWTIYGLGTILFGIKFLFNLFTLRTKILRNPKQKVNQFTYVLLKRLQTPYTFFNYIFLNKQRYLDNRIPQEIFWHEETHARQKHSIDVIFVEILHVIFWFNPLFYFIKKDIKLNHEFLADRAVLDKGVSPNAYQEILLVFSMPSPEPALAHAFNYPFLKKRFTVMKTKTSQKTAWIKSLILLPLLAVLVYGFSSHQTEYVNPNNNMDELVKINVTNFKINIENNTNKVKMTCEEGCAWKELEFTLYENDTQAVNQFGMIYTQDIKKEMDESSFLFFIKKESKRIILKGIKGSAWTDLSFSLPLHQTQGVDQNGMTSPYAKSSSKPSFQEKAAPQQIEEYNKLAKKYNARPEDKRIVPLKDLNRLESIYNKMTESQKDKAEPFPNCPPPPGQTAAVPEMVEEYNRIIKNANENNKIFKERELQRIKYLYNQMSDEQKENAEPFPKFPPPPASHKSIGLLKNQSYNAVDPNAVHPLMIGSGSKGGLSIPIPYNKSVASGNYQSLRSKKVYAVEYNKTRNKQDDLTNYINKNKTYEELRNRGPHYKDRTSAEQKILDDLFSELGGLYFRLSKENKRKTQRPIYPLTPYIKLMKDGKEYYKKRSELTEEDKALLPPPPPPPVPIQKTIEKGSKKLQEAFKKFKTEANIYALAVKNQVGTEKNNNAINEKYKKVMELHKIYKKLAKKEGIIPTPPPAKN